LVEDSILEDLSIPFILNEKSGQSVETHLETLDLLQHMHHRQKALIAFSLNFGFCFPFPDRKGYKEQSTKPQFETSLGTQPEQFRHPCLIAFLRLMLMILWPDLL
jgi:hypothetical protein